MYYWFWCFFIYSFLGWCIEVVYAAVNSGRFVNRGFLNGPVCPIYGLGGAVVIMLLEPMKDNFFILFFGSMLLTSSIELITGIVLKRIFKNQWWDYSAEHFNLGGYVCLKFSILWAAACVIAADAIEPLIVSLVSFIPVNIGCIMLLVFSALLASDIIVTVMIMLDINRRLYLADEIAQRLKHISNEIGENIYDGILRVDVDGIKENITEIKEDIAENINDIKCRIDDIDLAKEREMLRERYIKLIEENKFGHTRLFRAFPKVKSRYKSIIEEIKKHSHIDDWAEK